MVHILGDSIPKYVGLIEKADVFTFPGINVARLTSRVQRDPFLISKDFTIIHVGTNDVCHLSEEEILSCFNNVITVIRNVSRTRILISSILPRPLDYARTGSKVKNINGQLKKLCEERRVQCLHSFRPFFKEGKPMRRLFAVRDGGLHLHAEGTRILRSFFVNTVAHLPI